MDLQYLRHLKYKGHLLYVQFFYIKILVPLYALKYVLAGCNILKQSGNVKVNRTVISYFLMALKTVIYLNRIA